LQKIAGMKNIISITILCCAFTSLHSQILPGTAYGQSNLPDSLAFLFRSQLTIFPQEKLYLHTDKPYYISGEKIWFRAYLVDAVTHIPTFESRYVYVELINPMDSVVARVKIRPDETDAYHGYLMIPPNVADGYYILRAYTSFMQSLDEQYWYSKMVYIGSAYRRDAIHRVSTYANDDYDVSFYPEGGSIIRGAVSKVAFKAMNSNGQAEKITGTLFDQDGNEVLTFESEHLGMGSFYLFAQEGKSYWVECKNNRDVSKRFQLPAVLEDGCALAVDMRRGILNVTVRRPVRANNYSPLQSPLHIMAHTRGMIHLIEPWNQEKGTITLSEDQFPSGVLHIILFDSQMRPISERLVFINNDDQAETAIQSDLSHYAPRSLVKNSVNITNSYGQPLSGSFSVAVTSDKEVQPDSTANILTQLLLTSDLRGNIENPAYYFQNTTESNRALDLLMCTQGWRRYQLADLTQGHFAFPLSPLELGPEIRGTVTNLSSGRPVADAEVNAVSPQNGFFYTVQTNKEGRFQISINELPDSTMYIVSAMPLKGRTPLALTLDNDSYPKRTLPATPFAPLAEERFVRYATKAEQQYISEGGVRITLLPTAVVTASKPEPPRSVFYSSSTVSNSKSMTEEEINKYPPVSIYQALSRFPGVQVVDKNVIIRGISTYQLDILPYVLIDDVLLPYADESKTTYALDQINVYDIAQIDILNGAEAAVFGLRGANGIIAIRTKKGSNIKNESVPTTSVKTITPIGYQQAVAFYTPRYETVSQRNNQKHDLRTTIHWQPVVQIDSQGKATFEFYTADEPTSYTVIIEGVTDDGTIIRQIKKITRL